MTKGLHVRLIPEEILVASVRDDVVDLVGRCNDPFSLAVEAKGIARQEVDAKTSPLAIVAALVCVAPHPFGALVILCFQSLGFSRHESPQDDIAGIRLF